MNKEIMVALVCLVGSLGLYSSLGTISEETARTFPRVVMVVMIVLSALMLLQGVLLRGQGQKKGKPFPWGRFFLLLGIIVAYFAFMQSVGFYVSAFLFFAIVSFVLGRSDLTLNKGAARIVQAAVFTGVLFVLFKVLLKVQAPSGFLF
jgi:hypothetical protein